VPVRDVVERGLDILVENLAAVILAVNKETGADEDENGDGGIVEPDMGDMNGDYGGGWGGDAGGGWGGGGLVR